MQIFHYSEIDGAYLGTSEAREDPLSEGHHIIPAHATTVPPMDAPEGMAALFQSGEWVLQDLPADMETVPRERAEAALAKLGIEPPYDLPESVTKADLAGFDVPLARLHLIFKRD